MGRTVAAVGGDAWVQVPATWGAYARLVRARGDRTNPKYTYYRGRLTIVTVGLPHEKWKHRLAGLLEDVLIGLDVPFMPSGAVTLKRADPPHREKGTEGDASYYLTHLDRVRALKALVMGEAPPPDLVIEVVVSHPVRDALRVYAAFGVREVWVCKDQVLKFLVLGGDGRYAASPRSAGLPFLTPDDLAPWVFRGDPPTENALRRRFRDWVGAELAPRLSRGGDPGPVTEGA